MKKKKNTANNSQENLRDELSGEAMSVPMMSSSLIGCDGSGLNSGSLIVNSPPVPINKWNTERVLDWFSKRFPNYYDSYKTHFVQNQITGSSLLEFNTNCLNQIKIFDATLREQILEEIALLRIKNEYEFLRRVKSPTASNGPGPQVRD